MSIFLLLHLLLLFLFLHLPLHPKESLNSVAENCKKPGPVAHQRRRRVWKEPEPETVSNSEAELFLWGRAVIFSIFLWMESWTQLPILLEDSWCSWSEPWQEADRKQWGNNRRGRERHFEETTFQKVEFSFRWGFYWRQFGRSQW